MAHLWQSSERNRLGTATPALISDNLAVSAQYLRQAQRRNSSDRRIAGWIADVELSLATLHHDEKMKLEGYAAARAAESELPYFNQISKAQALVLFPPGTPWFREGVEDFWNSVERCAGRKLDRGNPAYPVLLPSASEDAKRFCENSRVAPHVREGLFLIFGDVLVESGQPAVAKKVYELAKTGEDYKDWTFRPLLESSIRDAELNSRALASGGAGALEQYQARIHAHSCVACHGR